MLEKRSQGRPKHGDTQVGRERIVSGFVEMVRSGSYADMSRKEIAQYVGITPALITYYFPKGHLLLIDSFSDVFMDWYKEFDATLSRDEPYDERLMAAFQMIVAFYKREFHVELFYADLCRKGILGESIVDRMKVRLARFLALDPAVSSEEIETSEILSNVIWGACQQCARLEHSDAVYDIVRRVAAPRPSAGKMRLKRRAMVRDKVETSIERELPRARRPLEQNHRFASTSLASASPRSGSARPSS